MNLQTLLVYSPFLALLYVLYALIQALRGKQQGVIAALLAFIAMGASLAAYVVTENALAKQQLTEYMVINAAVVFVASLLMLLIERRRAERDMNRSYGMLGIGLSILLALGIFITPLITRALPGGNLAGATANNRAGNSTLQTVSALTPGAAGTQQAEPPSAVAQVLSAQTGLSVADLTTQLTGGTTTIADLVSAHNGDLSAVTSAIASTLDQMNASGGQAAGFISRLGTDTSAVADQIVQGQLQGRTAQFIIPVLLTGSLPQFGGGNGGGGFGGGNGGGGGGGTGNNPPQATIEPTAAATSAPQENAQAALGNASASDVSAGDVLSAQTGLSAADLTTQLSDGSTTIAQLVSAHNGDLSAVTTAIASTLDQLTAAGGRAAQIIGRLGTDTSAVAEQIVQGQLQPQQEQFILPLLLTGTLPQFGGNGNGNSGATPAPNGDAGSNPPQATLPLTDQPTVDTATNTPTTERPTPIVFPTATATPIQTATSAATSESSASACNLITNYNLNLRNKPNKDGSTVLVSIPLGTSIAATSRSADGWYRVSYEGQSGWVDGSYASASAGCASLPVATP